jgi:ABC-type antimicrobial peptide transport system permease subunit
LFGKKGKIIGVLQDFHYNSLQTSIRPLIIDLQSHNGNGYALIRIKGNKTKEALASLQQLYLRLYPKIPFTFSFLDEEYQKFYRNEQTITLLSITFASLAILISCLGLLGLSMFTAEQRRREIGIRKVLGASITNIMILLSKEFMQLVFISFVIAAPVAWILLHKWLEQYAYRADMNWWIFTIAGLLVVFIALLTVSIQAFKASHSDPIQTMRSE